MPALLTRLLRFLPVLSLGSLVALVAPLTGCGTTAAIDQRADKEIAQIYARAEDSVIYPSCRDGAPIGPSCGLLLKRVSTEQFRERFRTMKCANKTDDECQKLYQRMIDASLAQRYAGADFRAVGITCDANPGRCDDPVAYELMLLESHNQYVRGEAARAENDVEAERARAHAEHAANVTGAVFTTAGVAGEIAMLAHDGPRCRSYPSVFPGAVNTVCTR